MVAAKSPGAGGSEAQLRKTAVPGLLKGGKRLTKEAAGPLRYELFGSVFHPAFFIIKSK